MARPLPGPFRELPQKATNDGVRSQTRDADCPSIPLGDPSLVVQQKAGMALTFSWRHIDVDERILGDVVPSGATGFVGDRFAFGAKRSIEGDNSAVRLRYAHGCRSYRRKAKRSVGKTCEGTGGQAPNVDARWVRIRDTAWARSCDTRDSHTPMTTPISFSVSSFS